MTKYEVLVKIWVDVEADNLEEVRNEIREAMISGEVTDNPWEMDIIGEPRLGHVK